MLFEDQERGSGINSTNSTHIRNLNGQIQNKQIHDKEIPMSEFEREISAFNKGISNNEQIRINNNIQSHLLISSTNEAAKRPEQNQSQHSAPTSKISSTMQDANNVIPNITLLNIEFNNLSNSYSVDHGEDIIVPNVSNGANLSNSNVLDHCEDLNVPNLSILLLSDVTDSQNSMEQQGFSQNIPQISALMSHSQSSSDRLPEV